MTWCLNILYCIMYDWDLSALISNEWLVKIFIAYPYAPRKHRVQTTPPQP